MDNTREKLVELIEESRISCGENGVRINGSRDIADHLLANGVTVLPESVWVVYPIQYTVAPGTRLRTVFVLKRKPIQDLRDLLSAQRMYECLFETKEEAELYKVYLERSLKT